MNEAPKVRRWGYSANDSKIFELEEGENLPEGYYRRPNEVPTAGKPAPTSEQNGERAALVVDAEKLGIDVDGRWGVQRLRDEIAAKRVQLGFDPAPDETLQTSSESESADESEPAEPTEA